MPQMLDHYAQEQLVLGALQFGRAVPSTRLHPHQVVEVQRIRRGLGDGKADLLWRNTASGTITELRSAGAVF